MRFYKNTCFRHKPTQAFLAGTLLIIASGTYLLYAAQNTSIDKYTQSQAHMSIPAIKHLIAQTYNTKPYEKIIAAALEKEELYKNDYYVFYHGLDNVWRVPQDLYAKLYAHFNPTTFATTQDFIFLRFENTYGPSNVQNFLISELKKNGLINDHGAMGAILLAANLALFGNVGTPSECSWEYFMKSRGHLSPDRTVYEKIMNKFKLPHTYINELMALLKTYQTQEETLLQIFIPKSKIDEIGYVAWIKGIPADQDTMNWVLDSVKRNKFPKTQQSIVALTEIFKKEQEANPLFKNLITRVKNNDFNLNNFLSTYRNNPETIPFINAAMARLIVTPTVLLNPQSGVKMFRYSTATPAQLNKYHQQLDHIFTKIISTTSHF